MSLDPLGLLETCRKNDGLMRQSGHGSSSDMEDGLTARADPQPRPFCGQLGHRS